MKSRFYHLFPANWALVLTLVVLGSGLFCGRLGAQATRADLIFALNSAVKARDKDAILACFHFDRADDATIRTVQSAVDQICLWRTSYVFSSERTREGPLRTERDGRVWTLNGEWDFQVHIFVKKPPSKGFVFPAGMTSGSVKVKPGETPPARCAILLLVEAQN